MRRPACRRSRRASRSSSASARRRSPIRTAPTATPRTSRPPTAISRWSSRPARTPSPSPISAARTWSARLRADADVQPGHQHALRLQPRQGGVLRSRDREAHRVMSRIRIPARTSSSSAPASAAPPSPPGWPRQRRRDPDAGARRAARRQRRMPRPARHLQRGHFRPKEMWRDAGGRAFNPGNYYYVGGNSKFYGAVLIRYREEDFAAMEHVGGVSPAWPFSYDEFEPWYYAGRAALPRARHAGRGPDRAARTRCPTPSRRCPTKRRSPRRARELKRLGLHPALAAARRRHRALAEEGRRRGTPFPTPVRARWTPRPAPLAAALEGQQHPARDRLPGRPSRRGARRRASPPSSTGRTASAKSVTPKLVILSAGAVNSAAILLRSPSANAGKGLANRSDQVGRNFMNHNSSADAGHRPAPRNDAVYQKTLIGLTTSISRTARAASRSAMSSCSARSTATS